MSGGFGGGVFSATWFYPLVVLTKKFMPDLREASPSLSNEWLLSKALALAFQEWKRGNFSSAKQAEDIVKAIEDGREDKT